MFKYLLICLVCSFSFFNSAILTSQEKVTVEGAMVLGNSELSTPVPGTIRWTGADFEGWNGSQWVSLTPDPCGGLNFVKDIEANRYRTVAIGTQCWTVENLRVRLFNDGTPIQKLEADTSWATVLEPAFGWPEDMSSNAIPFGALYNWFVADANSNGNKNVCPIGWHVPSQQELTILINAWGGENVAGNPLKETGNIHFLESNENATNLSGFTALPGGYRNNLNYSELGYYAWYWSTSVSTISNALFMDIEYDGDYARIDDLDKKQGLSIRCVKN